MSFTLDQAVLDLPAGFKGFVVHHKVKYVLHLATIQISSSFKALLTLQSTLATTE